MANTLVAQFQAAIAGIYGAVLPIAQNLFILLAAITITWSLIWWIIEKDDPVPIFVAPAEEPHADLVLLVRPDQREQHSARRSSRASGWPARPPPQRPAPRPLPRSRGHGRDGQRRSPDQLISNINIAGILGTIARRAHRGRPRAPDVRRLPRSSPPRWRSRSWRGSSSWAAAFCCSASWARLGRLGSA